MLEIDTITREILTRVIMDDSEIFLKDTTELELWFNDLILS